MAGVPSAACGNPQWTRSFDRARLPSSAARTAAVLGDPHATEYLTQAVVALGSAKAKSRALVFAAAVARELDVCLAYGSAAAALARALNVRIAIDLLHEVIPIMLPYSDTRAVRTTKRIRTLAWKAPIAKFRLTLREPQAADGTSATWRAGRGAVGSLT